MTERRSYSEGFAFSLISVATFAVLGVVTTYATARVYGVRVIGEYALAFAPTGAVWVLSTVREQPAMIRRLALVSSRSAEAAGVFYAVLGFSAALTAIVSAFAVAVSYVVFHTVIRHPEVFWPAVLMLAGYAVFTNTCMNLDSVLAAFRAGRQLFWIRVHQGCATLVIAVAAGLEWRTVWAYAIATVLPFVSSLLHRVLVARQWMVFRVGRAEIRRGVSELPPIIRFGLKMAPGFVADGVASQSGVWILGASASTAAVGAYSRAWSIGTRLLTLTGFVTEMTFPTLVERRARGNLVGFDVAWVDSLRYVVILMLLPAAAIGGAARATMDLMGAGFGRGAPALAITIALPALLTASSLQSMGLAALDRPGLTSIFTTTRMIFTLGLGAILIAAYGGTGAAIALAAGAMLELGVKMVVVRRHLSSPLRTLWGWREIFALGVAYASGFGVSHWIESEIASPVTACALGVAAGAIVFGLVFAALGGVNERDRARLSHVRARTIGLKPDFIILVNGMRTLPRTLTGAVALAVVGFLLARYGVAKTTASPPPLDRQASVADFKINYASTWHVVPAKTMPLVPMADVVTLAADASNRSLLVIGTQQTTVPGALPTRLAAAVRPTTKPQVVTLGTTSFYRYLNLTLQGQEQAESIYTLPTSVGTITAVCSAPSYTTGFTSSCERTLGTLKLTAGDVLSIGADPDYALQLNRILGHLNDVRRSAGPGLRSGRVGTRARAASALAIAHAQAASAAGHISVGHVSSANQALVTALAQNAAAYKALARAAFTQDVSAYGRAEAAVASAGSGLDAAYTQLRQLGYTIH